MKNTGQSPKYCFSLIRYSSEGQRDGTSVDRQADVMPRIAALKGWIPRNEWNITQEAVSAYKKHNFPALMVLIDDVRSGKIPQNTVCCVEAIDRLSRATLDEGREMLRQMLLAGIEICDSEGNHYTKEDLNDIVKLITMCLKLVAANEYVVRLSNRVKAAFRIRNEAILNGQVFLKTKEGTDRKDFPVWVLNTGKGLELNSGAAIIQDIFRLYLDGIGPAAIARKFNKEKTLTLSGRASWSQSVIYRLLSDRRVIGEMKFKNGEKAEGYFPAAIDKDIFLRVEAKLDDNRGKVTVARGDKDIVNLFSGVAYCTCGKKIKVTNGNAGKYITCYGHLEDLEKGCQEPMVKYQPFESAFALMLRLNNGLLRDENGEALNVQTQILKGRLLENEKQIANITAMVLKGLASESLVKTQIELENQNQEIKRQIELESARTVATKGGTERLVELILNLRNLETDQVFRMRVQGWIRENVNRITLNRTAKEFTVDLKTGKCITMTFDGRILGTKSLEALMPSVVQHYDRLLVPVAATA